MDNTEQIKKHDWQIQPVVEANCSCKILICRLTGEEKRLDGSCLKHNVELKIKLLKERVRTQTSYRQIEGRLISEENT